eukprot:GHVQ01009342.1.p1 GENE.GHVQ01009342.1~~GHVQ01009342.1.p1  ORF type:complete len:410 (+),score=51.74 GHVQ01009342.1:206-1435(+)
MMRFVLLLQQLLLLLAVVLCSSTPVMVESSSLSVQCVEDDALGRGNSEDNNTAFSRGDADARGVSNTTVSGGALVEDMSTDEIHVTPMIVKQKLARNFLEDQPDVIKQPTSIIQQQQPPSSAVLFKQRRLRPTSFIGNYLADTFTQLVLPIYIIAKVRNKEIKAKWPHLKLNQAYSRQVWGVPFWSLCAGFAVVIAGVRVRYILKPELRTPFVALLQSILIFIFFLVFDFLYFVLAPHVIANFKAMKSSFPLTLSNSLEVDVGVEYVQERVSGESCVSESLTLGLNGALWKIIKSIDPVSLLNHDTLGELTTNKLALDNAFSSVESYWSSILFLRPYLDSRNGYRMLFVLAPRPVGSAKQPAQLVLEVVQAGNQDLFEDLYTFDISQKDKDRVTQRAIEMGILDSEFPV